ncbi:AAA family ATPase [Kitasatospora sp. NBC_00240]|uniref:helix-turn-helix transcriptional regulator n=1 Tax=Kitasatospora sp. NBC_00240 TaxID=2903567 RepID=UPI002258CF01|nr:LuxR family transcriptional regulator [Kitasatospora sp. NBC_00240]MCX5209943.1 AAA family ATPase [Kitasatospora sp. NBC_00240]
MLTSPARAARLVHRSEPSGRDSEFRLLRHALDRSLRGRGGVVALGGAVGTGRTELLHVFSEAAADHGVRVLSAAGSPLEKDFPFGIVHQLFQSAGLDAAADAEVAHLLEGGPDTPAGEGGPRLTPRALHGLCSLVLRLAERAPLLLAVDDRQDADVQSLEFLLYLVRRTRAARVLTVLSSRETMTPPNPFFEVELARQPHHERVRLELLPAGLVSELLHERFGADAALRLTAEAHTLTGGNPLLVQALLEDQEPGGARHELVVGESYRRGLMNCLHRMDPLALRCARGVAVLGRPAEPELLAELLLLAPQSLSRASYLLHSAGLFHEGRFRHPTGGGDLLAAMKPEELAALHHRAAQLLRASGASADRVAEQLRSAEGHVRAPWATPAVGTDGLGGTLEEMLSDCDPGGPGGLGRPGSPGGIDGIGGPEGPAPLDGPAVPDGWAQGWMSAVPPQRPPRQPAPGPALAPAAGRPASRPVRAAGFHPVPAPAADGGAPEPAPIVLPWAAGPTWTPEPAAEETVRIECVPWLPGTEAESAEAVARRELKAVRYLFWHGRVAEGTAALERFEADRPAGAEPAGLRELRSWLGYWFRSLFPQPAPGQGAGAGDGLAVLGGLLAGLPAEESVLKAERILREGRLGGGSVESLTSALTVLVYADRSDRAARWCEPIATRTAAANCSSTWHALFSALRAEVALRQGDLRTAEEAARAAFARIRPEGWGVAVGYPLSTMISVRTALGRHEDAARYLALAVPAETFQTPAGLHYLYARGGHLLAVGRPEEALADFRACGELMARWDIDHLPGLVPWRVGAARAELALGRRQSAVALADRQLAALGPAGHARVRGMALRARAAAGGPGERTGLLERAVLALEAAGDGAQLAAALGELGATHRVQGDLGLARSAERRARPAGLQAARPGGPRPPTAEPPAARGVDRAVERAVDPGTAAPEEGADRLSDAERRVAGLAARGLTNREIARKLYITVSTVEQHLTRVYRKLGVRRRVDLRCSPYLGGELAG